MIGYIIQFSTLKFQPNHVFLLTKRLYHYKNIFADCVLYAVGKPVFHKLSNETYYGSWMRDPHPSDSDVDKIWATDERNDTYLFQYDNKTMFRKDIPSR